MGSKTTLKLMLAGFIVFGGCLDRKHGQDASTSEAGAVPDLHAGPPIDGPAADSLPAKLEASSAAEVSVDLVVPDVGAVAALDSLQGADAVADVPSDTKEPQPDWGPEGPVRADGPDVSGDLGPDSSRDLVPEVSLLPDVPPDAPMAPDAPPDLAPGSCVIGGTRYANGATQTGNTCQYCDVQASQEAWSMRSDGSACNSAASGQYCTSGLCKAGCLISGVFYASSAVNDANPCLVCQPSSTATAWTQVGNGQECRPGQICNAGSCQAGCWIGETFVGSGTTNPANTCQVCTPSKSTSSWSNNDAATAVPCGQCGGTAACSNMTLGACSKSMQTYYQDGDGDGYGNPLIAPVQNCNPTPGWVAQSGDCDDSAATVYPGVKRCFGNADYYTLQSCGNDGNWANTTCPSGCTHQQCKTFATADIAGQVTCGAQQCSTSQGCSFADDSIYGPPAACGNQYSTQFYAMCDGPNDCPGQVCCWQHTKGGGQSRLVCVPNDGSCPYDNPGGWGEVVCSPGQPACPGSMVCTRTDASSLFAVWLCK